ncbi:contact-dependent growth inhibition system immunity protein [Deinococcus koreensis]|uniref:contact-dependent growth inhibition system immunity protein n=1 Tax=Deinococcus koreensis TaxID=2054903 RepID=UPI0010570271|nr:contact-dependent growth inhibition system immunity protein [Deinococcus koreensis]
MRKPKASGQKKRKPIDTASSLAQLYQLRQPFSVGPDGQPSTFGSGLIDRCERLLVKPLRQFEPGDLRVMLYQQFYPETLVPLALPLLEQEPLLDGDGYPGDLLSSVLHQNASFWRNSPDLLSRIKTVVDQALSENGLSESERVSIEAFKAKMERPFADVLK